VSYTLTPDDLADKLRQQVGYLERSAEAFDDGHEDEAFRLATIIRTLVHDTHVSHSLLKQLGVKDSLEYLDSSEPIHPENLAPTLGLVSAALEVGPKRGRFVPIFVVEASDRLHKSDNTGRKKASRRRRPRAPKEGPLYLRGVMVNKGSESIPAPEPPYRRPQDFETWWSDPITKDASGALFSRSNYILAGANKEGGSHVDPTLAAEWAGLTRDNNLGYFVTPDGNEIVIGDGGPGSVEIPLGNPALPTIRQIAFEVDHTIRQQLSHLL
jgi:hypothetical protein